MRILTFFFLTQQCKVKNCLNQRRIEFSAHLVETKAGPPLIVPVLPTDQAI